MRSYNIAYLFMMLFAVLAFVTFISAIEQDGDLWRNRMITGYVLMAIELYFGWQSTKIS